MDIETDATPDRVVKRRQAGLTLAQRKAIRAYAQQTPKRTQKQLEEWFFLNYHRHVSQSTISEILGPKYAVLDTFSGEGQLSKRRLRASQWPELETALFGWYQQEERDRASRGDGPITGDAMKTQAVTFWHQLSAYQGMEVPQFSNGWLQGFRTRHDIIKRRRTGDIPDRATAASNAIEEQLLTAATEEQSTTVDAETSRFLPSNCYTCDETSLFYRALPGDRQSKEVPATVRAVGERFTAHFCCNADGSHKLPPWFIGNEARPRCFEAAGIYFSGLNCVWKYNDRAWMTVAVMVEWLHWFAEQIGDRQVLLLMDNFSAHKAALDTFRAARRSSSITVAWIPSRSATKSQPLTQGVIFTFKTCYRQRWLDFALAEIQKGNLNPSRAVNVLKAIRWSIQAWQAVTPATIQHCWAASGLYPRSPMANLQELPMGQIRAALIALEEHTGLRAQAGIEAFLNPPQEAVDDTFGPATLPPQPDDADADSDIELQERMEELPRVQHLEALQALDQLRLFELQQVDGNCHFVDYLDQKEIEIRQKWVTRQNWRQSSLTNHFT
jgi:hypothetical protein